MFARTLKLVCEKPSERLGHAEALDPTSSGLCIKVRAAPRLDFLLIGQHWAAGFDMNLENGPILGLFFLRMSPPMVGLAPLIF